MIHVGVNLFSYTCRCIAQGIRNALKQAVINICDIHKVKNIEQLYLVHRAALRCMYACIAIHIEVTS